MDKKQIRTRIAPSPTGPLHIGTARTALFNYLFAKNPSTLQQIQGRTESNRSATSSGPLRGKLQISSKLQTLLNQYKKQAFLSKHLVTIVQAVPINFILADCKVHDYDQDKAIKLLKKLEFKSLIGRLPKVKVSQEQGRLF